MGRREFANGVEPWVTNPFHVLLGDGIRLFNGLMAQKPVDSKGCGWSPLRT